MSAGKDWLQRACFVWEQQGEIYPALWATGEDRRCVAIPVDVEALQASTLLQTVLLGLMAQTVEATAIGTMHEAWTKTFTSTDEVEGMQPGQLAQLAEVDPLIRTALITTWGNLKNGKVYQDMASLSISDLGEIGWEYEHSKKPQGIFRELVSGVMSGHALAADDPKDALSRLAEAMNWKVLLWNE
jgi:hypothetical protein